MARGWGPGDTWHSADRSLSGPLCLCLWGLRRQDGKADVETLELPSRVGRDPSLYLASQAESPGTWEFHRGDLCGLLAG